jgi:hypothetical protein
MEIMNDTKEEGKEEALKFSKNKKERRKKISSFGIEQIVCLE